ncbi:MAG: Nif3-like dinuclear metal center hexameric protein [Armatimonadota bacterium]
MRASEIGEFVDGLVPEQPLGGDEGFRWGDPEVEVSGVLVAFMPTVEAIERCAAEGCNLLVAHELLHMPYPWRGQGLERHLTWRVNRRRIGLLARHGITLFRAHGTLDRFCVLEDFATLLGLTEPVYDDGRVRIHEIERVPLGELVERVKASTGLDAVRVSGELETPVSRVGLPWGGTGLSVNASFINSVIEHHPDVLIAGESDEYAMRMIRDCDVTLIETGHAVSEEPGLEHFARHLAESFPEVRVVFHRSEPGWRVV